ncbi:MAG TPA: alpha/beta hydrolase-fold protein [Kofleriaceae bacterium]|nr:alpha/beta hydrolase-fold protein [Kofleriaceae bacterium]
MPVIKHRLASQVLADNPLGDPSERDVFVYVPPGYDPAAPRRYPALLAIVGFTGTGGALFNIDTLVEPLDHRLDRLIGSGACPPVIVAAPDCFTRVGGNQYINSAGTGRYEDFLVDEVIPLVDAHYRTLPRGQWGVFGKSSGGYGSIVLGMRRPDVFCALADHSGDSCFELCYIPDFPGALDAYRAAGGPGAWLASFWADANHRRTRHHKPLNVLGMAAHYSPNPSAPATHARIDWPFDLETGELRPAVWERWRALDPVNMAAHHADNLRKLRAIYVDCGTADEFALHWGARALVGKLRGLGIAVRHEEFDDGHMQIPYRYDRSLPFLAEAIGR